ncbi:multiple organellar RNA editing factor 8, chloroplastic/mitochondrial-like [Iris pallida]|uniref:Multiple organellar RNA editing factor 8, chloroplastic/mitochondrial-like n=1 Tax=Iris pallida TaxID=29817 RepID=A0AAX6F8J0_IRIPA|nr:multiple organellar RNA editing factor 8, chloroplastic/mitochondrial-like [Iris pallida]
MASRTLTLIYKLSKTPSLLRLRPLVPPAAAPLRRSFLFPAAGGSRTFSTRPATSSLNDPSPNWSSRPPKETILLDGCDFEHWLCVVEPPEPNLTRDEIIDSYIKTLAQVLGSEEEAKKSIYSVSTKHYFAFGCIVSEELSYKIKTLPNVRWVLPDSYLDVKNKDYGGEPFIDGKAVPYDPKYHEEWVRNNARANERSRRNDRPRNFDRSRNFERRRENMQTRDFQNREGPPVPDQGFQNTMPPQNATTQSPPPPNAGYQNQMPPPGPNQGFQNPMPPQNARPPPPPPNSSYQNQMPPPVQNQGFHNTMPPQHANPPPPPTPPNVSYQNQMPNSNYQGRSPGYQGYQGGPRSYQGGGQGYVGGNLGGSTSGVSDYRSGYQGNNPGFQGPPPPGNQGVAPYGGGNYQTGGASSYQAGGGPNYQTSDPGYRGDSPNYQAAGSENYQGRDLPGRENQ